jgi:hypothetical protein
MPIRPIDLQTLLMQLGQVGREQAAGKEGAVIQQAVQGAAVLRKQTEAAQAVRKPEEPEGGAPAIREKERGGRKGGSKRPEEEAEGGEAEEGDEVVRDPSLGRNVDISG